MWNPKLYGAFEKERLQPSLDLAGRLKGKNFKRILDVGCGSGMSTSAVAAAFPEAEITGADLSESMLEAAAKRLPEINFVQRDCGRSLSDLGSFDLVFSNAFMQWLPNQGEFIENSFEILNENGVFAAQLPLSYLMPTKRCIDEAKDVLPERLRNAEIRKTAAFSPNEYYEMLSRLSDSVDIWVTDYFHVMNGHEDILNFIKGTALNPYTERLSKKECDTFLNRVLENIKKAYAAEKNGKVLFPFKRLFMTAEK